MALKHILQNWGFIPKPPIVEYVEDTMLPTAGPGDDGQGWKRVSGGFEREIKIGSCPGPEWTEHAPGYWHKGE
jgi:hypothetical protein